MLHNSLFFKEPLNYESGRVEVRGSATKVLEMTDNDYATYSTEDDIDIDMSDGSDPTAIDYVFIKYKGTLTSYTFTPTGGSGAAFTRTVPTAIDNYDGDSVDLEVNGFKHDLVPLATQRTATSVRMQFTGSNLEVYALMLLELGFETEANSEYLEMGFDKVDRAGHSRRLGSGRSGRGSGIGAERWKWEYRLSALLKRPDAKALFYWMEANPNFAFAAEFSRHPERVFPAYWGSLETRGQYFARVKGSGDQVAFSVSEQ